GERDDLHEPLLAQLAGHGAEDSGPARVAGIRREQDHRVVVEADVRPVRPPPLLRGPDDDGFHDLALLHRSSREGVLDRTHDDVADRGVAAVRATQHADDQDLLGPRVVRDLAAGLLLDHLALSTISTTRQRLVLDSGRVSITRTLSPTCASLASSCAASFEERRTVFL